ncbi:M20 family metallopeptidase [Streptomyces sp. NPDC059009]|uniref:M20 metallopeptidase family protein n=1 Tax=Streptomyces sp. NPDC059009 TaxID=3346694 RepID=UPI003687BE6D
MTAGAPQDQLDELLAHARTILPDVTDLRRRLHRHPELGLHLPRTQEAVCAALADIGLTPVRGKALSSVTATIDGAAPGPTVLLRADMDALPQQEETGLEFASEVPGRMHACGHDMHTSMLVGAARLLAARTERLAGRVVLMFQPAEESDGGALHMIEEGVLTPPGGDPVAAAFALHVTTRYPSGTVHLRPGPTFAASDTLHLTVHGAGGHASTPHLALDPIPVACEIVQALQTMITRTVNVFDPAVLTVARIDAGTTTNIIPETARIDGTLRTLSPEARAAVLDSLRRVVHNVAAAHGATATVELSEGYPPVVNDTDFAAATTRWATAALGTERVHRLAEPFMGAEDFSYVLEHVPGTMAFLGTRPPGQPPENAPDFHSNRVVFDEPAMATGTALYAAVACGHLAR